MSFPPARKQSACDMASALLKSFHTRFHRRRDCFRRGPFTQTTTHHALKMAKYKLEYLWLDGYEPVANIRGKTQVKEFKAFPKLEELPMWGFGGSSTRQAEGRSSDCMLKPVAVYPDTTKKNGALVMCEVMLPDGKTPHPTNGRAGILDD